jgi:hypothetical protein
MPTRHGTSRTALGSTCGSMSRMTRAVAVSPTTPSLVTPHHTRPTPGLLPSWAPLPAPLSRSGCQATTSRTPQVGLPPPSARSSACTGTSCSSTTAPNAWQSPCRRRASQVSSVQRGPERSSASSALPIVHGHRAPVAARQPTPVSSVKTRAPRTTGRSPTFTVLY